MTYSTPLYFFKNFILGFLFVLIITDSTHAQLPGTTIHEINKSDREALIQLMSEGPCPCSPEKTLLICIKEKSCEAATKLAEYGVSKFKEGLGKEQVIEAVVNKFIEENIPPATFELKETAFKGSPNAPIVIVEFADFECPHCAMMSGIIKELMKTYPKMIKVYFKQFPLRPNSLAAQASLATLAAQRQGAFWPMHDLVFAHQHELTPQSFEQFAQQIGINLERFKKDMEDPEIQKRVKSEQLEGIQAQVRGTPSLFFNGKLYRDPPTFEALNAHVKTLINPPAKEKTAKEKTAKEKTAKEKTAKEKTAKGKTTKGKTTKDHTH